MGKDLARTAGLPWEIGNKVIGAGAEAVSDDPETQAGIKYVGEILLGLVGGKAVHGAGTVSYTHLTLPTILLV